VLRLLRRLVDLGCLALFLTWSVLGIPGIGAVPGATLLASGAVLGALALVFQSLLRDFVCGLVVLLDDRYAIGDTVEIDGITGEVTDVGVLSTDLQCGDRQVLVLPNSACEKVLNHSKLLPPAEPG
jgi:small conductance mechanosensitive channel